MNAAILLCVTLLAASPVEPTARWNGIIADKSLQMVAPADGFLADAESLAKVWKAWRADELAPSVDFAEELILVGVVPGPNTVSMRPSIDEKGDLQIVVAGTKKAGPGFGYLLLRVSRGGVQSVNGRPLEVNAVRGVQVTVKVVYGTGDESQSAEIEPWISKVMAEAGSPFAATRTDWIVLTGDARQIHASTDGGFNVGGKVTERNGQYDVEIHGCDGAGLQQSVTLKPGERRAVKLTDYPEPTNVFIAVVADLPAEEVISVTVVGTLRTGIFAIGGETTGATTTAKGVTWELDFGENVELRQAAEKLDGEKVTVIGKLDRRAGVEIKERWIVTVTDIQAVDGNESR